MEDIDEFVAAELNSIHVSLSSLDEDGSLLRNGYWEHSLQIATHLITLQNPADMTLKEFDMFMKEALK